MVRAQRLHGTTLPSLRDRKICSSLQLRIGGIVTQAARKQVRWRRVVASNSLLCSNHASMCDCSSELYERSQAQRTAESVFKLGLWASYRSLASFPSHHTSRRREPKYSSRSLSVHIPIPFLHIGPCPVAYSILPSPCVPEFPLSLPITQFAPSPRIVVMEPGRR